MKIIGLSGRKGSGKNTAAQIICQHHDYQAISFADSLKDCVASIFGWDRDLLEGLGAESRVWREQVDHWWADKLGIEHFTPRFAMTNFGSDVMRKYFHDEIWLFNTERKIANATKPVILTDVRFPIEARLVKQHGGTLVRVDRGHDPKWLEVAKEAAKGDAISIQKMKNVFQIHDSEWAWLAIEFDHILPNHTSKAALEKEILRMRF